ncbi:pentatricopeptide repeat-containing protein At4g21170 isoform X2 [Argentina anserina]|uniref:pentatricopeptide repeat-containing protein At4g21170 isoform X2 n=1 Tax=Argentina anserina TaxID=57926 RepID=UPI002176783A|nr:pentatricopeptide repeat-containing protein At4g21170 isoform X2 [Potentilla anserina]
MLPLLLHKAYSTTSSTSLTWRTQLKQAHLASQISSILLQRRNWVPLLQNLNLPKLNPPLFLQILHKTQQNPQLSLDFFNWAKFHLRFEPDLKSHCQIIQLSLGSGLTRPVKPILDTLIQTHHVSKVVQSMVQVTVLACNALLNTMRLENETRLGWGFYGAMIRNGIISNQFTWSLVAQFLCKDGKFERIVKLLDSGVCDSMFYSLLVDGYSKSGNFEAAFCYLDKMSVGKLDPGFSTYSSVLDGACKHGNVEVVERVMRIMLEKKLLSKSPVTDYNSIVKKLCDLNKIYAAEMFFKKACEEKIELQIATYGCMLQSLTTEMRIVEAIWVYRLICERGIVVDDNSYNAFANVLCKKVQFEEGFELLMDVIRRGFSPCASELSGFISFLCGRRRWREAEDVLNSVLDKGLLPDLTSCSSLVRHYCSTRRINSATALHSKMEKLNGSLDATTYNVLLGGLFAARRVEEAVRVFDYMRSRNLMSSESFTIMIRGLCQVKELRKAMKIHDEMLKLGLKPPVATYRRLIHGFRP